MARSKKYSRASGETVFTDPREAARHIRKLMKSGAQVHGTKAAMSSVGIQPHHWDDTKKMPDAEARLLSQQTNAAAGGPVAADYSTPSSNPQNPRTAAAGYDPVMHRLRIEWGDGGPAYNYYDVPPQIWDSFQQADSPGKYINTVLNYFNYGPAN